MSIQPSVFLRAPVGGTLVPGGATFRVWAPRAQAVHVSGDFNGWKHDTNSRMAPIGGGHWASFVPGLKDDISKVGDPMNLKSYDIIIAFDPDWKELTPLQKSLLKEWVEGDHGGGLIFVSGPQHTQQPIGHLRRIFHLHQISIHAIAHIIF